MGVLSRHCCHGCCHCLPRRVRYNLAIRQGVIMAKFWKYSGWSLVAIAVASFTVTIGLALCIPTPLITAWRDRVSIAASALVVDGLLLTVGGLLLSKSKE